MAIFVDRPISAGFIYAIGALAVWLIFSAVRDKKRVRALEAAQAR